MGAVHTEEAVAEASLGEIEEAEDMKEEVVVALSQETEADTEEEIEAIEVVVKEDVEAIEEVSEEEVTIWAEGATEVEPDEKILDESWKATSPC